MRTRRTTPSVPDALPARDQFESSVLYELVSSLSIDSYGDLLAPHWSVPDRPACRECLERERFTRRRSRAAARAVLTLHADRSPDPARQGRAPFPVAPSSGPASPSGARVASAGVISGPPLFRLGRWLRARADAGLAWLRRVLRAQR